ncbi:MAG TPA: hypothetical protein VHN20_06600 [Beijerinckiaceae bacterium]|nr:hypothetical protein [Beijerinckiaceae bacterium]
MTRTAALRASVLFVLIALIFGAVGAGSHAVAAQALSLIGSILFVLMLAFWLAPVPEHRPLAVRVRRPRALR